MTRTAFASDDRTRLFDDARQADITAVAGVPLRRAGRRMRGECPLCGASKGKKASGAFSADPARRVFTCWACGAGGDVIELERLLRGGSPREAAERLVGADPSPLRPEPAAKIERAPAAVSQTALRLWRNAQPARGTLAEAYLRRRGLDGWVLDQALGKLRFHPDAFWGFDDAGKRPIGAPAMVACVYAPDGPTGGCHVTYLSEDGRKARLDPAKRMWGPQVGGGDRRGGAWLLTCTEGPLIVGEGIESTLSAAMMHGGPCSAVATLSLGAMQGGWLRDKWGRVDADMPRADPDAPAFTWSPKARSWDAVMIAIDRDMSPIRVKVRKALGGTAERILSSDDRARICAGLASAAWRRTGVRDVRAIDPGPGRDFNDLLRGA